MVGCFWVVVFRLGVVVLVAGWVECLGVVCVFVVCVVGCVCVVCRGGFVWLWVCGSLGGLWFLVGGDTYDTCDTCGGCVGAAGVFGRWHPLGPSAS